MTGPAACRHLPVLSGLVVRRSGFFYRVFFLQRRRGSSPGLKYKLQISSKSLAVKGLRNLSGSASRSSSQVVLDARVATPALGAIPLPRKDLRPKCNLY